MLVLDSGESDISKTVLTDELTSEDDSIKPVSDKIPIVQLAPGQRVKVECYARLGRGREHAKWNSSNIATLVDTDKENEKILTVETTGALNPEEIILAGVEELGNGIGEFKDMVEQLKE
jgi:DNA-directed RNA polymerase subunit D